MKYCRYCGERIPDDSLFCQNCGKRISLQCVDIKEIDENVIVSCEEYQSIPSEKVAVTNVLELHNTFGLEENKNNSVCGHDVINGVGCNSNQNIKEKPIIFNRGQKLREIKKIDFESRAGKQIKTENHIVPLVVGMLIFIPSFILAVTGKGEQLFPYLNMDGFVFTCLSAGIIVGVIVYKFDQIIWKEYNNCVREARNMVEKIIKTKDNTYGDWEGFLERRIDRKLFGNDGDELLMSEFYWHTARYCWGCGRKHSVEPIEFDFHKTKSESWKETPLQRYYREYSRAAKIKVCPECYKRLTEDNEFINNTWINLEKHPVIHKFNNTTFRKM